MGQSDRLSPDLTKPFRLGQAQKAQSKSCYHQVPCQVALMFRAMRLLSVGCRPSTAQRQPRDETMLERTGSHLDHWTPFEAEKALLANRTGRGRLGLAVLLKYFQLNGRIPRRHGDVPGPVLAFLGEYISVPPEAWFDYDPGGRTGKRDREQVRRFLGFRPIGVADERQLCRWLEAEVAPRDLEAAHLRTAVTDWCRERRLEPPAADRAERLIGSAVRSFEEGLFAKVGQTLGSDTRARLDALVAPDPQIPDEDSQVPVSIFARLKGDPGRAGLASVEEEVAKLGLVRDLELPDGLWAGISPKVLTYYHARAATETAWHLRRRAARVRWTMLAAFCWQRRREISDGLVDLLIQLVHRIGVRAEQRVAVDAVGEIHKVEDKSGLLFRIAAAALENPDRTVREVLFPLVGEETFGTLVQKSESSGPTFRQRIQTLIHRSYAHHYRRMLPPILDALTFRSDNTQHRPVIDALDWLRAHRVDRRRSIPCAEIPVAGVVRPQLRKLLIEEGPKGERIDRIDYEICVLQALRERLRCKEIWVDGADRYRNFDEDLTADFEARRDTDYLALGQPLDVERFIAPSRRTCARAWRPWTPACRPTPRCACAPTASTPWSSPPGGATRAAPAPNPQGGGRSALADDRPVGRAQGDRPAGRIHRGIQDPGYPRGAAARGTATAPAAVPLRPGHQRRAQAHGRQQP